MGKMHTEKNKSTKYCNDRRIIRSFRRNVYYFTCFLFFLSSHAHEHPLSPRQQRKIDTLGYSNLRYGNGKVGKKRHQIDGERVIHTIDSVAKRARQVKLHRYYRPDKYWWVESYTTHENSAWGNGKRGEYLYERVGGLKEMRTPKISLVRLVNTGNIGE